MTQAKRFQTPGGHLATIHCRPDTNDRMVAEAVIEHDEYALAELPRKGGRYIDIGAHIGSWIIAAMLDDREATGVAVEPVPDNVALLRTNLEENGLQQRVRILERAFATRGPVRINYGFVRDGDDEQARMARMHRYIGNQRMPDGTEHLMVNVPAITPAALFKDGAEAVKTDTEGAEAAFVGADLSKVQHISGEYHTDRGPLYAHLSKTHYVAMNGSQTFGYFVATPR